MKQQKRSTILAGVPSLETGQRIIPGVSCPEKRNTEAPSPPSPAPSAGRGSGFRRSSSLGGGCLLAYEIIKTPEEARYSWNSRKKH